jgi:AcrR family transcriptional regulator
MRSTINLKQRELLLDQAQKMFVTHGIKNLTMDMIAKSLSMSKKTIYVMVRDKSQLVMEVIERYIQSEHKNLDEIKKQAENPLHELVLVIKRALDQTEGFNPETIFDMQKHYPESFQLFTHHRNTFLYQYLTENLKSGKQDGFYRSDFDEDVIAKIYIGMLKILVDQSIFPSAKYPFIVILKEYLDYHLRAIVTPKGLEELARQKELNRVTI